MANQKVEIRDPAEERINRQAFLILGWLCLAALAIVIWIARRGFMLTIPQILTIVALAGLPLFYVYGVVRYWINLPSLLAKQWPRPRLYISRSYDKKCMDKADVTGDILLGYEHDSTPVYWSQDQRTMQTNLPGKTGSGKTTLLLNIVEQDIRRGHPVIYIDGKGDKELVIKIMDMAFAAGRGNDVRVIDPSHPEISAKFNPFYDEDGLVQQRVGAVFESLGAARAKDEFFAEHQRAFLNSVTAVLEHTGKQFTFWDVLVACQSPDTMNKLIESCREKVMNGDLPLYKKNAFLLAAANLKSNYEEKDWITKIRGLLNSMMPFVSESLALITGSCEHLVTFEEVVKEKQILVVSMNVAKDSEPTKALGRILMRSLQFMIASRYNDYVMDQKHSFISIVLDEFGLYAYQGFKDIIHTARQANACFIFSFQSMEQLAMDVGPEFASDMASAPSTNFMMKISNEDTAKGFLQASAAVPTAHFNLRVEKGTVLDRTPYTEDGSGQQSETLDTRVKDYEVKMLPRGQMIALLPDEKMGVIVKRIHVRRGIDARIAGLPAWLDPLKTPIEDNPTLNLQMVVRAENETGKPSRRKKLNASTPKFNDGMRSTFNR